MFKVLKYHHCNHPFSISINNFVLHRDSFEHHPIHYSLNSLFHFISKENLRDHLVVEHGSGMRTGTLHNWHTKKVILISNHYNWIIDRKIFGATRSYTNNSKHDLINDMMLNNILFRKQTVISFLYILCVFNTFNHPNKTRKVIFNQ